MKILFKLNLINRYGCLMIYTQLYQYNPNVIQNGNYRFAKCHVKIICVNIHFLSYNSCHEGTQIYICLQCIYPSCGDKGQKRSHQKISHAGLRLLVQYFIFRSQNCMNSMKHNNLNISVQHQGYSCHKLLKTLNWIGFFFKRLFASNLTFIKYLLNVSQH